MSHEEVTTFEELMNTLFKSEDGETVIPKPSTFVLFSQDEHEGKKTINDVICAKGEAAVIEYLKQFPSEDIRLIIFRLNIINAEVFASHPHIRLKEYPTLLSVDGCRRLEGSDVANENILNLFFEQLDVEKGRAPSYRMWYYPPLIRSLELCKNYWKRLGDEEYETPEFENPDVFPGRSFGETTRVLQNYKMPDDLNFWDVLSVIKNKISTQMEINSISQGLDMKSIEATKVLEEQIRKRFRPENIKSDYILPIGKSYGEGTDDITNFISAETPIDTVVPSEFFTVKSASTQEDEPIILFDLDALCLKKEILEIERKQKPLPPVTKPPKKKKKGKKKKGKGKGKKGKGKTGKGKKGKGKKKGK